MKKEYGEEEEEESKEPFPAKIQDDLRVETDRPGDKSEPTKNFIGYFQWK